MAGPELSGALGNGGMLLNHVLALDTAQRAVVPGLEVATKLVLIVGDRPQALAFLGNGGPIAFPGGLDGEGGRWSFDQDGVVDRLATGPQGLDVEGFGAGLVRRVVGVFTQPLDVGGPALAVDPRRLILEAKGLVVFPTTDESQRSWCRG